METKRSIVLSTVLSLLVVSCMPAESPPTTEKTSVATLIQPLALTGSRKSDGTVNAGGFVYLTAPGTNVAVTAYRDRDASAAWTLSNGGYVLDAAGKAALFIQNPANVRVTDSTGVNVDSFTTEASTAAKVVEVTNPGFTGADPVSGASVLGGRTYLDTVLASAFSSIGPNFQMLGTGASVATNVSAELEQLYFNVLRYGADPTGAADSGPAFQSAINAAQAGGCRRVYVPAGNYSINQKLLVNSAQIGIVGAGRTSTTMTLKNLAGDFISISGSGALYISDITLTASSLTSFAAISNSATSNGDLTVDKVTVVSSSFRYAIDSSAVNTAQILVIGSRVQASVLDANSVGVRSTTGSRLTIIGSSAAGASSAIQAGTGQVYIDGTQIQGSGAFNANGLNMSSGGLLVLANSIVTAAGTGSSILLGASVVAAHIGSSNDIITGINDQRTSTPGTSTLAGNASVSPSTLRTDLTVIIQGGAAATTTISPSDSGLTQIHGARHTIICSNTSGGALTWTFNAQYVLVGGAAPAPATGNRIALTFVYDAPRAKWYEVGTRASTVN